jgi:hypothetical protein
MSKSKPHDDEVWVDRLGDRAWIDWARATAQEDPVKSVIEGLSLMLAEFASSLTTKPDTPRVVRPAPLGVPPFSRNGGDGRVERSLYQRANGYNYEAVKVFPLLFITSNTCHRMLEQHSSG